MSHLSTLIARVERADANDHESDLQKAVRNLREYVEAWSDFTKEEYQSAKMLYDKHRDVLSDEGDEDFPEVSF